MHEKHADDGHGQGEDDGPDGALPQASVLLVVRLFRPVFQLFAVVAHQQVVARSLQGRFQLFGAALCRVVFHGSRGRRVVDGSRAHPRLSVEGLVHPCGAGGATHVQYGERPFFYVYCIHCVYRIYGCRVQR